MKKLIGLFFAAAFLLSLNSCSLVKGSAHGDFSRVKYHAHLKHSKKIKKDKELVTDVKTTPVTEYTERAEFRETEEVKQTETLMPNVAEEKAVVEPKQNKVEQRIARKEERKAERAAALSDKLVAIGEKVKPTSNTSSQNKVAADDTLVLYVILAILIPPLAIALMFDIGEEFWICLILTLLFYLPGIIYAVIKVLNA